MSRPRFFAACLLMVVQPMLAMLAPARALEPEQREATVVSARVWDGDRYREIFVPSTREEMTVIAGRDSVAAFVRTLEYYWPLSRQIYVDFARQRDAVEGELVIRRDNTVIARIAPEDYAILYPEGAVRGRAELLWGEEARKAHAAHVADEARFARDFAAARRANSTYERKLLESAAGRQAGEEPETIEPPPAPPEPSLRLVTAPERGYRLSLEPGTYALALERDGRPVPGTERRLRAVDLRGSEALVADIVPSERWTRPLATNTTSARIFAKPGTVFYLTLSEASRFEEADYLPVVDPQAEPVAGRTVWIRRQASDLTRLHVAWGRESGGLLRQPLKVEQTRGTSFGYHVRAAREGEAPDLDAFVLDVPSDPAVKRGAVYREAAAAPPFLREVVVVQPRRSGLALILALLPIAGALVFAGWRRMARR